MNKKIQTLFNKYRIEKDLVLSSGQISDHYYDIKSLLLNNNDCVHVIELVGHHMLELFPDVTHIAGYGIGGILFATRLASCWFSLKPLIIRTEKKEYGLTKQIEGDTSDVKKVIIVDDVCTTGKSLTTAKEILAKFDIQPVDYYVICRRERSVFYCESYFIGN